MIGKHKKAIAEIKRCIKKLQLDLNGYEVLTEVGSNNYLYTPIIALMAGAARVHAWTSDTKYCRANNIVNDCKGIIKYIKLEEKIDFATDQIKPTSHIRSSDIITNSGFLRPLNEEKLKYCKKKVVIPLMYEYWEIREEDIDIEYCRLNKIKVAGTWENHPSIGVFSAVGHLAIKLALEAGYEVYQNKIVVWSNDHFGEHVKKAFENFGAEKVTITIDHEVLLNNIDGLDFIFICDYDEKKEYLHDSNSVFNLNALQNKDDTFGIVHLYGYINYDLFKDRLNIYPKKNGYSGIMSQTLGYLGLKPIINLQTASFKVAQEMLENKLTRLSQPIIF